MDKNNNNLNNNNNKNIDIIKNKISYLNSRIKNINIYRFIEKNNSEIIIYLISILLLSYPNFLQGLNTYILMMLLSYFFHRFSHYSKNIASILHHYHHENNNSFSHNIEILLEISSYSTLLILCCLEQLPFINYFNKWVIIAYSINYIIMHNLNYSILKVNKVHHYHHINMNTNIGPDFCDVIFSTKNYLDEDVENTSHYIPIILISLIFVSLLKQIMKIDNFNKIITNSYLCILIIFYIILFYYSCKYYFNI